MGSDWKDVTCARYLEEVKGVAKGLIARGVKPGDRLAIMSHTRYEWSLIAWASWVAGAVSVPIYETSSPSQCDWILTDSGASLAIVENLELREVLTSGTDWKGDVLVVENDLVAQLTEAGAAISDEEVEKASLAAGHEDTCAIIYTSGTTGNPKGCEIVHGGFGGVVMAVEERLQDAFVPNSRTLIFLPLAHVLARILEVACFYKRVAVAHEPDTTKVVERLSEIRPTFLVSVPRVLEKVYNSAAAKAETQAVPRPRSSRPRCRPPSITPRLWRTAARRHSACPSSRSCSPARLLKLHEALGASVTASSPAAAPRRPPRHFYRGAGFDLLRATAHRVVERPHRQPDQRGQDRHRRRRSLVTIQIADDGEVLAKAKTLFKGYWQNLRPMPIRGPETGTHR